jgi:hypothetical protein
MKLGIAILAAAFVLISVDRVTAAPISYYRLDPPWPMKRHHIPRRWLYQWCGRLRGGDVSAQPALR